MDAGVANMMEFVRSLDPHKLLETPRDDPQYLAILEQTRSPQTRDEAIAKLRQLLSPE